MKSKLTWEINILFQEEVMVASTLQVLSGPKMTTTSLHIISVNDLVVWSKSDFVSFHCRTSEMFGNKFDSLMVFMAAVIAPDIDRPCLSR